MALLRRRPAADGADVSAAAAAVKATRQRVARTAANASGSITLSRAQASPSSAISVEPDISSAATARRRSTVNDSLRSATIVSVRMKSSNESRPERPPADCAVTAISSSCVSESCVSTLNVRTESSSSPKKSIRTGNSDE